MIRVRYYKSRDQMRVEGNASDGSCVQFSKRVFMRLMCGVMGEPDRAPFRDAESRKLLYDAEGYKIIEDDWYSIDCGNCRTCMADLATDLQYALVLLDNSRKGIYTICESMTDKCWESLDGMPFDILIACSWEDIFWTSRKLCYRNYVIENFPYHGGVEVNVIVRWDEFHDGGYEKVEDDVAESFMCEGLSIGKDGKYYINSPSANFRYYWREHLDEILGYIDKMEPNAKVFEISDKRTVLDFAKHLYKMPFSGPFMVGYCDRLNYLKKQHKSGEITWDEFKQEKKELKDSKCYQRYLELRDRRFVINHMYRIPDRSTCRKLPILLVKKFKDGHWGISGDITYKYPEQWEIIEDALHAMSGDYESFTVIVDVDEMIDRPRDLERTIWCIWSHDDLLEFYDKHDGLKEFARWVRDALASGDCEVSKDFY